jgi:cell division septal protein FtsQ
MTALVMRHRLGCATTLLALIGGLVLWTVHPPAVAALREHPYFAIQQLVITGCGPSLSSEDVRTWLGLSPVTTVWEASPARVRERLLAHPRIAWTAVRRTFPDRLEIVIRERRPQAIAALDELYYLDRSGAMFGPLGPQDNRDYPVITGLAAADSDGTRQWLVRRALRLLRRCDRNRCIGELSEISLDAARGVVVYPVEPSVPIVLGWGSWPVKLERAQRALQAWHGGGDRLASLDLRYRNQVLLTLRGKTGARRREAGAATSCQRAPASRLIASVCPVEA